MTITTCEARRLASDWHGGQWSPLYALSSTGTVTDRAADEIRETIAEVEQSSESWRPRRRTELAELRDLLAYVEAHQGDAERAAELAMRARVGIDAGDPWPSHAWPGCYPLAYVTDDADTLCGECMNREGESVHFTGDADGWRVDGVMAEEGPEEDVHCAHCGNVIAEGWRDEDEAK